MHSKGCSLRLVLVIEHVKKVSGMDVTAVRSAAKQVFQTLWDMPDVQAQLKPEELTNPTDAKRRIGLMQSFESPMCKRSRVAVFHA